jgi:carbon-monoxide dehydrogenase large subunit
VIEEPGDVMSGRTLRVEDRRLLTGAGRFTADLSLPGQVYGVFLRSPRAHAVLTAIDAGAALAQPGIVAVLTGGDIVSSGFGMMPAAPVVSPSGSKLRVPPYRALAEGRVRFAGQPVALVVATSAAAAQDAAELVEVSYDELPCVVDVAAAIAPGAPQLHDGIPGNVAIDYVTGDKAAADAAFATAAHVARVTLVNQRIVVCAMEPRAAIAAYDAATDRYTLHSCSQSANSLRDGMAGILKVPPERLRVVTGDVGGGFGMKTPPYPEYVALLLAARRLGRPVKWVNGRGESFLSDNQARDTRMSGELALDAAGRFLAMRIRVLANGGAYLSTVGAGIATRNFASCLTNVYATAAIDAEIKYVLTNTAPVGPYRGAGRPEAAYVMERLVEQAARDLGIDAVELRRRNLIPPAAMPYATPSGTNYDSGDFPALLGRAEAAADRAGLAARKRAAAARGKLRGQGFACFVEVAGAAPGEYGEIRFTGQAAEFRMGGGSTGQGHETLYANLVAERLGVPPASIRVVQNDTDLVPRGNASVGSRTTFSAGACAVDAVARVIEKGKALAGHRLEASARDIEYASGAFRVAGTDRSVTLWELAAWSRTAPGLPAELAGGLDTVSEVKVPPTFPNGCHVAEVEIDRETGAVELVSYLAVDDAGTVLDHMMLEGQIHGGVAQGVGQVLVENGVYDPATGQLVAGSFMDYGVPRAGDLPFIRTEDSPDPARTNELGAKGVGEAGTTGAVPAVVNAIIDALAPLGISHFDMPATPLRVWQAMTAAGG